MNFLKKLGLATSSGIIFQYPSPDSAYTNDFSTCCMRNLQRLIFRLSNYLLIREIISLLKLELNCLDHKIPKATPALRKSFPVID